MKNNVRKITEGAMMVALYGLVLMINRQLAGLIEGYVVFLLPLPLIVYAAKYDFKSSLVVAASVFFLTFMWSLPTTYFYMITTIVLGVTYGSLVRKGTKNGVLLSVSIIISIISNIITCLVFAAFFGYDLAGEMEMYIQFANLLFNGANYSFDISKLIVILLVSSVVLAGIMEGIIVHLLSLFLLKRLKIKVNPFKPIVMWNIPRWSGYLAFTGFSSSLVLNYVKMNSTMESVIMAVMSISTLYLVFFGFIACLVFGVVKYKKNLGPLVLLITIILFPIAIPTLSVLGFWYITSDFKDNLLKGRIVHEQKN